jgi:hypothetical protein
MASSSFFGISFFPNGGRRLESEQRRLFGRIGKLAACGTGFLVGKYDGRFRPSMVGHECPAYMAQFLFASGGADPL